MNIFTKSFFGTISDMYSTELKTTMVPTHQSRAQARERWSSKARKLPRFFSSYVFNDFLLFLCYFKGYQLRRSHSHRPIWPWTISSSFTNQWVHISGSYQEQYELWYCKPFLRVKSGSHGAQHFSLFRESSYGFNPPLKLSPLVHIHPL